MLISTSLPRLPAAMTSILLTLQPVGSVALAALIFGESPSALQLGGVATVLGALVIAGRSGGRSQPGAQLDDPGTQPGTAAPGPQPVSVRQ